MRKAGTIYISLVIALLAIWLLPRLYRIITAERYSTPFTLYSCVIHDFISLEDRSNKEFMFKDSEGREYGDSVQPLFYHRAMKLNGSAKDTINGRALSDEEIETNNIFFTSQPEDVNRDAPNVYMLLESVPVRGDLQDPEYAFVNRKKGLAFIRIEGNKEDAALSGAFAAALDSAGFVPPAKEVSGNPSTRKEYDEGYLMTDSQGKLFHIKLKEGKPAVEYIPVDGDIRIKHIFVTENENRATLAYFTDEDNRFFILDSLRRTHGTDVVADPEKQSILLIGDVFYYTIKVSDNDGEDFWALKNGDFTTEKTLRRDYPESAVFDLPKYIFPVQLSMTSGLDPQVKPRFHSFSWYGLIFDIAVIGLVCGIRTYRRRKE